MGGGEKGLALLVLVLQNRHLHSNKTKPPLRRIGGEGMGNWISS